MTTSTRDLPDLRAWAGQQLGLPSTASADEARIAFLRKLADCNWLPAPALEESHAYWANAAFTGMQQALLDEEVRLRTEIDAFAEHFFDLAPRERCIRHQNLTDQCTWSPTLSGRLSMLAPGLRVDSKAWAAASPTEQELIQHVCRLFALAPAERARRRWELIQELEGPRDANEERTANWAEIARLLESRYPGLANLEPVLLQELASSKDRRRRKGRLPTMPKPAAASGNYNWAWTVVVIIAFGLIRVMFGGLDRTPPPPPNFQPQLEELRKFQERFREHPEEFRDATEKLFGRDLAKKLLEKKQGDGPPGNPLEKRP